MSEAKVIMFYNYTKKSVVGREKTEKNVFLTRVRPLICSEFTVHT